MADEIESQTKKVAEEKAKLAEIRKETKMAERLKESERIKAEREAKKLKEKQDAEAIKIQQSILDADRRLKSIKSTYKQETALPANVTRFDGKFCYTIFGNVGDPNVGGHLFKDLDDLPALKARLNAI